LAVSERVNRIIVSARKRIVVCLKNDAGRIVDSRVRHADAYSGTVGFPGAKGAVIISSYAHVARDLHSASATVRPCIVTLKEPHRTQRNRIPVVSHGDANSEVGQSVVVGVVESAGISRVAPGESFEVPVPLRKKVEWITAA
jgi:hypothetical protein